MDERYPYFTQDGGDRECGPGQYIANMRDGAVAGYRFFDLKPEGRIRLRVRGKAAGRMLLLARPDGGILGEVPIHMDSREWTAFDGTYAVAGSIGAVSTEADSTAADSTEADSAGKQGQALYLNYEGQGAFDFLDFTLF